MLANRCSCAGPYMDATDRGYSDEFSAQKESPGRKNPGTPQMTPSPPEPETPIGMTDTNESQEAARSYQRGSRNPRPCDPLAFWRWYSA
jgi:hypothetical protein